MSAYRICEECGAALDPGERCDCRDTSRPKLIQLGSPHLDRDKESAASA